MAKQAFLEIGQIVTTHGIAGEVRVKPWCDAQEVLTAFDTLYFDKGKTPVEILQARAHKNIVILKLAGVDTVEAAQKLRDQVLYVKRSDFPLPEGSYFIADLIGMQVRDNTSGEVYGTIVDVLQTGANDVYDIKRPNGKQLLIPAIPDVIVKTDLETDTISINMLEGLMDDAD